ncbi:hypothetical protein BH11PSE12_BH11PSE12_00680 [soil metagenome]
MLKKNPGSLLYSDDERPLPPLKSELFSVVQMEQHGCVLAGWHQVHQDTGADHSPDQLLPRLADNEDALLVACAALTDAVRDNRQITPAAEWLLDNFYLIEEQVRTAKQHLPKGYSKELPRLVKGPSAGRPRVYDIALETISHGDGRVDPEGLRRFVAAYQQITVLKLGELWAIPIMLRLALIENLRRVAVRIALSRGTRNQADSWADQMIAAAEKDPSKLILLVADMARSEPVLDGAFVAELTRRLQGHSPALTLPLTWVAHRLAENSLTIEQVVQLETQQQAADQVSISNSIGSLRFLGAMDWREFVESLSHVEHYLRQDPTAVYDKMDFSTRDRYRHVIENLAKTSPISEVEVTQKALALAHTAALANGAQDRTAHIGFYLVDKGLSTLEEVVGAQHPLVERAIRSSKKIPLRLYLMAITTLIVFFSAILLTRAYADGLRDAMLVLVGLMVLFTSSQLAIALVNWLTTVLATPHPLPRMDFSKGIPASSRSLVVVPTMLIHAKNIDSLSEALEVRFLANRDDQLQFCLLTDLADSATPTTPSDEHLIELAAGAITRLNETYGRPGNTPFLLLHRPRCWNEQEQLWMGYERKRGKLSDLNAFLRGGPRELFLRIVGNTDDLASIRYVITLDTDTQLPRDSARLFIATMAHPLNQARYDESKQRVCDGYGILQPRVVASLPSAHASFYEKLCGGEAGIDPYTRTVSDVYQDLFQEGSFIGKGIYDVDAFELALQEKLPENRILSHDLLEGCYARAGLISDVQLHEEYPSRYSADVSRRHRWIRGDWQLLAWFMPKVPVATDSRPFARVQAAAGLNPGLSPNLNQVCSTPAIVHARDHTKSRVNPLTMLSRWKILDNLRRSLIAPVLLLLVLLGWAILPSAWIWSGAVLTIVFLPSLLASFLELVSKPPEIPLRQHVSAALRSALRHLTHAVLNLAFLPYEAYYSLDAILRTLWRMLVSHKRMLEWKPSSEVERQSGTGLAASVRAMWVAPVLALVVGGALTDLRPAALPVALPLLLLWYFSPAIAWWISRPYSVPVSTLHADQIIFLQKLARKTWSFFETYVGPEDNYLPPDNMQEYPVAAVAHRTSPTNIGLALLSNVSAYDFAYIDMGRLLTRTENTMQTMARLERHQGHFYNWYDTQSLMPLHPVYVSTVDSGNLAGHLLTLRAALLALPDQAILSPQLFQGIEQTFRVLLDVIPNSSIGKTAVFQNHLDAAIVTAPDGLIAASDALESLAVSAMALAVSLGSDAALANSDPELSPIPSVLSMPVTDVDGTLPADTGANLLWWAQALVRQCREAHADLRFLAPWLALPHLLDMSRAIPELNVMPHLRDLVRLDDQIEKSTEALLASGAISATERDRWSSLSGFVAEGRQRATERIATIQRLALQAAEFSHMEYGFLYDTATHLLTIGYNVSERRRDVGCYDLLASEARLCSFVAIAQGQLPQETWFALGRQLTIAGGEPILLSWSGSMFEYLMPLLVMPTYQSTLLDQTYKSVVQRQIDYGVQRDIPWGVSESGYQAFDASLNYQYRAFGVPGLGFKRGLGDDLVVAPYASMLALMVAPEQACSNLQRLAKDGIEGRYGMYEAIDYSASRLPRGQSQALIRSYMAHHQGMSLLSLAYVLLDQPMQKRFESDPLFQATLLLLKERIPKPSGYYSNTTELADIRSATNEQEMPMRVITKVDTRLPEVQLLSNGRYHVMVTNTGGSYSRWRDLAVTRWREDSTCDHWGSFCYLRDLSDGSIWSTAYQPTLAPSASYEVIFSEGRAEYRRHDNGFDMHTEIVVSPEDDIELRRTRITNRSRTSKTIDITSYAEVVLTAAAADNMHPAFSNLFVQTEILAQRQAILCSRRPRSENDFTPTMFHLMVVHGVLAEEVSYETDRMAFIGRGNTVAAPLAMVQKTLSGKQGSVLDPIVAIRHKITLAPEQTVIVDIVTGVADTREVVLGLIEKYQDRHLADRVFELAWTHSQVILRQLNASEADAQLYGRLANSIIYSNALLRADASILVKNRRGQSGLWSYAISGDLPIVLLQIRDAENIELVRQMVQAHAYWRTKGLAVDLVIWNEDRAGYRQLLQDQIMGLVASGIEGHAMERPGGIFVRLADQIPNDDRILLQSVARAILCDSRGSLAEQINRRGQMEVRVPALNVVPASAMSLALSSSLSSSITSSYGAPTSQQAIFARQHAVAATGGTNVSMPVVGQNLLLFNGLGGFAPDGREYVIHTGEQKKTPAPWVNVMANAHFGSVVSESGQAYTWGENAHEFRLTPWSNDPVSDKGGEVFYVRDEDSGHFWSPTPLPCTRHGRGQGDYVTRHGFGYSVFEHQEDGVHTELWVYVALDASVKFSVLKIRNQSGRSRRLSATGYVEWVLGDIRQKSVMHVVTEADQATGALFARNSYNTEFSDRIAFFYADVQGGTVSGDRTEFIGRNGSLAKPAAMKRARLSGKLGAGLDPCAAIQIPFELADGEERELIFILGMAGQRSADVSSIVRRFRGPVAAREALTAVKHYWDKTLSAVQVMTPDPALNILTNGWLVYQTMACRLWARSGFYQSGGAYGFRDQLQDVMALMHTQPQLAREHLLLCSAHQFVEGDAQHWWHPPSNRGVRTHCSDDYLWLALATCRYVSNTHDYGVLDETIPFLEGRSVNPEEDSYYDLPGISNESASLYEHCVRAILHGLRMGEHGLPLMGSCDWNDGMDKVGAGGKGESVWLAFFLYDVVSQFAKIALQRGDQSLVDRCQLEAKTLQANIEKNAWDGGWYRRAYFDDGTPLGSASNAECQIDSISQSWSVLSGAGEPGRAQTAMLALDQRLVKRDAGLVLLLDPPFDQSGHNPGYISGYVPGVRENGGQYTHAAIWTGMAFAKLGDSQRAWEVLDMINPINHGSTPEAIASYKVEPYVIAADVYGVAPHVGRGGWTWYTGSSGWMYRFILESLLGVTLEGDKLRIAPCLPADWTQYQLRYRYRNTLYHIGVHQLPGDRKRIAVSVDGVAQEAALISLLDDRAEHQVEVTVGGLP